MKKIISLIAIAALSLTTFSTAIAAPEFKVPAESAAAPVIKGEFVAVDVDGTYQFNISYEAGTTLTAMTAVKGKYTGTAINSFDATLEIDPTVWDVSDPDNMVFTDASGGVVPSATCAFNKLENKIVFTWSSNAANTYIAAEEGLLYTIWLTPKDTSLDGDAVKMNFSTALIQIESKASNTITYQTEYSNLSSADYPITTVFGPEGGEEGGSTVTPVAMDAGVEIAEGPHAGKTSVSAPEVVAVADFAKIEITNDVDTSKTLEWTAPTTLGDGKTNVLAVLVYDKAAMAGSTFTVKYLNAASEAIKIFTHAVAQ